MRLLRQSIVQRVLGLALLVGFGLWLVAPATGAARSALVPSSFGAPPTVEAAFEQALASAQKARTPEAFVATFADALGADPDLAQFLDEQGGTDALLAVLYGHLLRAFGHERGIMAAPASPVAAPTGASPVAASLYRLGGAVTVAQVASSVSATDDIVVPLAVLSAAQPLGP